MNLEPIIKTRFSRFQSEFGFENIQESAAFEHFVNYIVLSTHQPDAFRGDKEFLKLVNVGSGNDMGIDGLAVKLNGIFVQSVSDVDDILEKNAMGNVEFIFVQTKNKSGLDVNELGTFLSGVRDFLGDEPLQPHNDEVAYWLQIKDYIFSDELVAKVMWDRNPIIRAYYIVTGSGVPQEHHNARIDQFRQDIAKSPASYEVNVHVHGGSYLKETYDNLVNKFRCRINFVELMPLSEVEEVENSCLLLCNGDEFVKMLATEDGVIRRSLFDDNVRDYQGVNTINSEIEETIKNDPKKFVLLNNGITIVCDKYTPRNRLVDLENPQIVNGCQTSSVLFDAHLEGIDLSEVSLAIKLIATDNDEVTNLIVKGTNRQNIVHDVAFETTRPFHKLLEDFFNDYQGSAHRIYYERRSKQYQYNQTIKHYQRISFKRLIQSFVGMFLCQPYMSHRHEYKLLSLFQNTIFRDSQSKLPYFTAALASHVLDKASQDNEL